jgi:REP element-mobilizing transposase RayT
MWNLPPPPGFRGFDPERELTIYTRKLPHWRQPGATYFVTFRVADSLPREKIDFLMRVKAEWLAAHNHPSRKQWEDLIRKLRTWEEKWLDRGHGSCPFANKAAREIVANSLRHFDGQRYELGSFVVMPNHVHAIVRPFDDDDEALSRVLHSWKRHSAGEIHGIDSDSGELWQAESYDRIVRDEEHLYRCIQYIGRNPRFARRAADQCALWISPVWQSLGWTFNETQ